MLSDVREAEDQTLRVSVRGVKLTLAAVPAALEDFQTPPPAVPR
jgi:hypothetical protein